MACRAQAAPYTPPMARRTSPDDAAQVAEAADLEHIVQDKRDVWRATSAKARRRQRRYKALLTRELVKQGGFDPETMDDL